MLVIATIMLGAVASAKCTLENVEEWIISSRALDMTARQRGWNSHRGGYEGYPPSLGGLDAECEPCIKTCGDWLEFNVLNEDTMESYAKCIYTCPQMDFRGACTLKEKKDIDEARAETLDSSRPEVLMRKVFNWNAYTKANNRTGQCTYCHEQCHNKFTEEVERQASLRGHLHREILERQKESIPGSPYGNPLVEFERCTTCCAGIEDPRDLRSCKKDYIPYWWSEGDFSHRACAVSYTGSLTVGSQCFDPFPYHLCCDRGNENNVVECIDMADEYAECHIVKPRTPKLSHDICETGFAYRYGTSDEMRCKGYNWNSNYAGCCLSDGKCSKCADSSMSVGVTVGIVFASCCGLFLAVLCLYCISAVSLAGAVMDELNKVAEPTEGV